MRPFLRSSQPLPKLVLTIPGLALACADEPSPVGPLASPGPAAEIVDAVHNAGNSHFYFLPPLVPNPSPTGTADGTLEPEVSVCEWNSSSCGTVVAQFSVSAGTGSALVGYDAGHEQYSVNWRTDQCTWGACSLDETRTYRLSVRVGSVQLGHADLRILANAGQARNLETGEYIGLISGRTLPVRFRIEQGIATAITVSPDPATVRIGATRPLSATVTDLHGAVIPDARVLWSVENPALASVDEAGIVTGLAGGCTRYSASIQGLRDDASLIVTPTPADLAYALNNKIHVAGADGCNPVALDAEPGWSENEPAWSPDGSRVAYAVHTSSGSWLAVANADGSGYDALPTTTASAHQPQWSPDGGLIAYNAQNPGQPNEVYVIAPDGSGERRVTFNTTRPWGSPDAWWWTDRPRWSPDGSRLVFYVHWRDDTPRARGFDVFTVRADGTDLFNVTSGGCYSCSTNALYPTWSPTGGYVAYQRGIGLWRARPDGTDPQQVSSAYAGRSASWSPDGSMIAFVSQHHSLEVAAADGSGSRTIIAAQHIQEYPPAWSRDGTQLYYTTLAGSVWTIRRVNVDGTGDVLITPGQEVVVQP